MAGYELPVTRMDQLGVGTTDYLGRSLAGPGDSHSMSRSLAGGPGVSLSSPSSLSSSIHISTGKSSRPVSPPMIQVLTFLHCAAPLSQHSLDTSHYTTLHYTTLHYTTVLHVRSLTCYTSHPHNITSSHPHNITPSHSHNFTNS